jgi:hypothetical protein
MVMTLEVLEPPRGNSGSISPVRTPPAANFYLSASLFLSSLPFVAK